MATARQQQTFDLAPTLRPPGRAGCADFSATQALGDG